MIRRLVLGTLVFAALPLAQAQAAQQFSCKKSSDYAQYPDLTVTPGRTAGDVGTLIFAASTSFSGTYQRKDEQGKVGTFQVTGTIPTVVPGEMAEHLGSLDVIADVSPRFTGTYSGTDTKIIVDFSMPEGASETFAATIAMWAQFADGSRAMLCKTSGPDCVDTMAPVDCTTL